MSSILKAIDLMAHLERWRSVLAPEWHVGVVDNQGTLIASSHTLVTEHHNASHGAQSQPNSSVTYLASRSPSESNVTEHRFLVDQAESPLGSILFVPNGTATTAPAPALLDFFAEQLVVECELTKELDAMAVELADRYEELNLVYATSEQVEEHEDDDQLLGEIVQNVVAYLDAEFAVLSIPQQGIWVTAHEASIEFAEIEPLLLDFQPKIFSWMEAHQQPLVVNHPSEAVGHDVPKELPFRLLATPVRNADGAIIGGFAMCRSLQDPRISNSDKNLVAAMSERVSKVILQNYDDLTGWPKQQKFERQLHGAIQSLSAKVSHSLIYISNVEADFIREHYGNQIAEKVTLTLTEHVKNLGRDSDLVARLDDGDLVYVFLNCDPDVAETKANELIARVKNQALVFGKNRIRLRIAVGLVKLEASNKMSAADAIIQARLVNKVSRDNGLDKVQQLVPDSALYRRQRTSAKTLACVHSALADQGFELYAQAITPLASKSADPHFELLLRLHDEDGEIISPVEFIPVAEKNGLMTQVDHWVLGHALLTLEKSGITRTFPDTVASVNLSGQSLSSERFLIQAIDLVKKSAIPAKNICFEVTETAAIDDLSKAQAFLASMRELGCRSALDDFGAGLSSFTYLRKLPLDYVKVDGSFVKDMLKDHVAATMVECVHRVGSAMGLETVAEYVENDALAARLTEMGIHFGQGYGLGKPMPVKEYLSPYEKSEQIRRG